MASETTTEPETQYKEAPFAEEVKTTIPAKVHIVAPSTLPEGYVFDAEVGHQGDKKTISVEVVSFRNILWLVVYELISKCMYSDA